MCGWRGHLEYKINWRETRVILHSVHKMWTYYVLYIHFQQFHSLYTFSAIPLFILLFSVIPLYIFFQQFHTLYIFSVVPNFIYISNYSTIYLFSYSTLYIHIFSCACKYVFLKIKNQLQFTDVSYILTILFNRKTWDPVSVYTESIF